MFVGQPGRDRRIRVALGCILAPIGAHAGVELVQDIHTLFFHAVSCPVLSTEMFLAQDPAIDERTAFLGFVELIREGIGFVVNLGEVHT
jgi:hypothetical protein